MTFQKIRYTFLAVPVDIDKTLALVMIRSCVPRLSFDVKEQFRAEHPTADMTQEALKQYVLNDYEFDVVETASIVEAFKNGDVEAFRRIGSG